MATVAARGGPTTVYGRCKIFPVIAAKIQTCLKFGDDQKNRGRLPTTVTGLLTVTHEYLRFSEIVGDQHGRQCSPSQNANVSAPYNVFSCHSK